MLQVQREVNKKLEDVEVLDKAQELSRLLTERAFLANEKKDMIKSFKDKEKELTNNITVASSAVSNGYVVIEVTCDVIKDYGTEVVTYKDAVTGEIMAEEKFTDEDYQRAIDDETVLNGATEVVELTTDDFEDTKKG